MTEQRTALKKLLLSDLDLLTQSAKVLETSHTRTISIGIKSSYNDDQLI